MSHREFTATRTMLANAMATAGAELLEYMGVGAALAATRTPSQSNTSLPER